MKLEPLSARVVVERHAADAKSKGGILIPESAKEKPQKGTVLAVGPGSLDDKGLRIPVGVKVGDVVLFQKWCGAEFDIEGKKLLIVEGSDLLAICG